MSFRFPRISTANFLNKVHYDVSIININYIDKQINNEIENNECPILNKKIEANSSYLCCNLCSKKYLYNKYYEKNTNCPYCKTSLVINKKLTVFINK